MNNATLHVCALIIQTNHYIYSIILIMNYSPECSMFGFKKRLLFFFGHTLINPWIFPKKDVFVCQVYLHINTPLKAKQFLSLAGQSGRDRRQWDSSCWRKLGITRLCRGCSRPLTSTRRAWCRTSTPARLSISTGGPPRPRRPCKDHSSRGSCCTGYKGEAILPRRRPRLCPLCQAGFPGPPSGERTSFWGLIPPPI